MAPLGTAMSSFVPFFLSGPLELTVTSSLVMIEYRKERQRVWGGLVEHRVRRTDAGLRIAAKRVDLVNSESELCGIACLF